MNCPVGTSRALSRVLIGIVFTMLVTGACGSTSAPSDSPVVSGQTAACPSTPEEEKYGCGPISDGSITYQPDVVMVGGGAAAIRSRESNGVSWTIDGAAPRADEIAVGRVVFVTDRVVGRVISAATVGNDIRVTFGPAELGEIIRDGTIRWSGPLSFENATSIVTPDLAGRVTSGDPGSSPEARARDETADTVRDLSEVQLVAARQPLGPGVVTANDDTPIQVFINPGFDFYALCCTRRMGALISLDQNGKRMQGGIWLRLNHPTYDGYASFLAGGLIDGFVEFEGIEGIHLEFEASTAPGPPPNNIDQRYLLPIEYLGPRSKLRGVPPMTTAWQGYWLKTAFSAGSTTLVGSADYDFTTNVLRAKFNAAGVYDVRFPDGFKTKTPLLDTLTGVSVGVNGFVLGMINNFCLCYGASVYSNGLYVQLAATFGVSNDSSAVAMLGGRCRVAVFKMVATVGAGHHLAQSFADQFNEDYRLEGDARIEPDLGVKQVSPLWERFDSLPVGFKRCD